MPGTQEYLALKDSPAVAGLNEFAISLLKRIASSNDSNIFFSPASIHTALSMLYLGARGSTATEIAEATGLPTEDEERTAALKLLAAELNANEDGYLLSSANSLWCDQNFTPLPAPASSGSKDFSDD
ncbi:MAG: serpin family protein [Thermodesulfobacteriota bacterium]